MADQRLHLPEINEYREQASRRRAEAFCDAPVYILGTEVRPITPRSYSMLCATRSAFAVGGKIGEREIRNFIWYHSPRHCHYGKWYQPLVKWWILRGVRSNLSPWWCRLFRLSPPVHRYVATLALYATEIQAMIEDAFADSPPRSSRPGKPVACVQAFFIHEFAVGYGWTPERTSNTPLNQVIQLHRCLRMYRGEDVEDQGEEKIRAMDLLRKNIKLVGQRVNSDG